MGRRRKNSNPEKLWATGKTNSKLTGHPIDSKSAIDSALSTLCVRNLGIIGIHNTHECILDWLYDVVYIRGFGIVEVSDLESHLVCDGGSTLGPLGLCSLLDAAFPDLESATILCLQRYGRAIYHELKRYHIRSPEAWLSLISYPIHRVGRAIPM